MSKQEKNKDDHMIPEKSQRLSRFDNMQKIVDETVREVGGYWTPLSALARVTEELGEISEIILETPLEHERLVEELADLFIITTCLANQYCVRLGDEYKKLGFNPTRSQAQASDLCPIDTIHAIVPILSQQIGKIARILNYYEGQKKKKDSDNTKSLREEIARLHLIIFSVANLIGTNINSAIEKNLSHSKKRDAVRFDISSDPITERSLANFRKVVESTHCIFAKNAKIWGAKNWVITKTIQDNILSSIPWLERFAKVSDHEQLDGFVIEIKLNDELSPNLATLGSILNLVLRTLAAHNPSGHNCFDQEIETPSWRFSFGNVTFFISTFSNIYTKNNSRYSPLPGSFFIFFQPEKSFDHNQIHSDNPKRGAIKNNIRRAFEDNNKPYNIPLVEQKIEAFKYIKPLKTSEKPIKWWEQ